MEALAFLATLGLGVMVWFMNIGDEPQEKQPMPQPQPVSYGKVVEATENTRELPDGTIVTVRNVRQWQ